MQSRVQLHATNMKIFINFFAIATALSFAGPVSALDKTATDRITRDTIFSSEGIELTSKDCLTTPGTFQPPVAITIVAKTDSHDLRMAYAADQVIFNWETTRTNSVWTAGQPTDFTRPKPARFPPVSNGLCRLGCRPNHYCLAVAIQRHFGFTRSGIVTGSMPVIDLQSRPCLRCLARNKFQADGAPARVPPVKHPRRSRAGILGWRCRLP